MDLVDCISQYIAFPGETKYLVSYIVRASSHEDVLEHHTSIGKARGLRCHEAVPIGAIRLRSVRRSTVHSMKRCGTDDGVPPFSSPEARHETNCL